MRNYTKLIVLSFAFIILLVSCADSPPSYADYTHKPMEIKVDGDTKTLDKAQKLFNEKDYQTANTHLARLAGYYTKNAEVQLYFGITFLELDQYPLAHITFDKVLLYKDSGFVDDAQWYLALMALKQNDLETCKTHLKLIVKDTDRYEQASGLLKKLND